MNWILLFVAFLATTTLAAPTSPTTSGTAEVSPMVPQSESPTNPQDASSTILMDNSLTVAPEPTNNSPTVPKDSVLSDFTEAPLGHISKFDKAKALVKTPVKAIKEFVGFLDKWINPFASKPTNKVLVLSDLPEGPLFDIYSKLAEKDKARLKVAGKALKETVERFEFTLEVKFLKNLIGLNQELQLDERIISILVEDYAVSETDARQAVEEARKEHYEFPGSSHKDLLHGGLSGVLPIMEEIPFKQGKDLVGQIYLAALQKIGVGHESDVYNDDRMMDLVFAMMLIGEKSAEGRHFIDPVQFEIEMRNHVVTNYRFMYLKSCQNAQTFIDNDFKYRLGSEMFDASRVWKTLKEARQMIKSSGESNNDHEMMRCLVKKLSATANLDEIRKTMEKTRHAITLRNAVMFSKAHSLRKLVASGISFPVYIFGEIVLNAASSDIFRILRQHPSFQADVFSKLMDNVLQKEDRLPIVNDLLKDLLITHATLVDGLVKAGPTSIQALIFKEIFQHAERVEILKILGKVKSDKAIIFTKLYDMVMNDATCSLNPRLKNLRGDFSIQDFKYAVNAVKEELDNAEEVELDNAEEDEQFFDCT